MVGRGSLRLVFLDENSLLLQWLVTYSKLFGLNESTCIERGMWDSIL